MDSPAWNDYPRLFGFLRFEVIVLDFILHSELALQEHQYKNTIIYLEKARLSWIAWVDSMEASETRLQTRIMHLILNLCSKQRLIFDSVLSSPSLESSWALLLVLFFKLTRIGARTSFNQTLERWLSSFGS